MRTLWRWMNTDVFPVWLSIPLFIAVMYVGTWVSMYCALNMR